MSNHKDRAQLFKQAVTYLADRGGEAAVLRAFSDPEPIDELWGLDLPDFREALKAERGAA